MTRRPLADALVLVALTLPEPAAWAAPHSTGAGAGSVWSLLLQLWADVGCIADPYGGCGAHQAQAPPPASDEGCWIDPNGGCRAGGL